MNSAVASQHVAPRLKSELDSGLSSFSHSPKTSIFRPIGDSSLALGVGVRVIGEYYDHYESSIIVWNKQD